VGLTACSDAGITPQEGFIDVEGGQVWYQIVGSGSATPLLLLHGGPGAPSYYLKPLERVAVDRPVIFYDQLGAGRSPAPADSALWTVERFVNELAQVRAALGLDEHHENQGTTDAPEYREAVMDFFKMYMSRSDPWSPDFLATMENFNSELYGHMWGPSEFTATGTLRDYNREADLPGLNLPVLFTTGRYDEATPKTVRHFQSLVPGAEIQIFENSAHMTMVDEPDAYAVAIRDFLNRVDAGR
jgi:proline iminopeptidase